MKTTKNPNLPETCACGRAAAPSPITDPHTQRRSLESPTLAVRRGRCWSDEECFHIGVEGSLVRHSQGFEGTGRVEVAVLAQHALIMRLRVAQVVASRVLLAQQCTIRPGRDVPNQINSWATRSCSATAVAQHVACAVLTAVVHTAQGISHAGHLAISTAVARCVKCYLGIDRAWVGGFGKAQSRALTERLPRVPYGVRLCLIDYLIAGARKRHTKRLAA